MFNPKESILDKQLATSGIENHIFGAIADVFTGGAHSRNKSARSSARRQNQYNQEVYEYQLEQQDRRYQYDVEGLDIIKRNNEANLQFQEHQSVQRYNYNMGIRAYEFAQANRVYDQSVSRAIGQQNFNQLATQAAFTDQARLYHEQLIDLSLDETETLLNYGAAAAGVGLKKRQAKTAAATSAQQETVAALKAAGTSQARGVSGRSAAKNIQGVLAESGARQTAIVDKLMFDTEATDQELFRMNQQLVMDQVGFEFSRDSARLSNMAAFNKIKAQSLQSAINAEASIALKPEIAPPMPKPIALPRPEYQDVFKPGTPPKPMKAVAQQENLFAAGIKTVGSMAVAGLSGQGLGTSDFRGFNWGKAVGGIF